MDLYIKIITPENTEPENTENTEKYLDYADIFNHYNNIILNNNIRTDSGIDLICPETIVIQPNSISNKIKLNVACEPSFSDSKLRGYYLFPRSSLGTKTPLRVSNSIGLIDYEYRGVITLVVDNISNEAFTVKKGMRLCQLVSYDSSPIKLHFKDNNLSHTNRDTGGFGSTGGI